MVRVLAALLLGLILAPLCSAEPIEFAAPLNVAAEKSKIVSKFIDAQKKKLPYAAALAARDAAFGQLAAAAEQAKSNEYRELSLIYDALGRPQDVERTARAVLEKSPQDVGAKLLLFKSLCDLKRVDEAGAQFAAIVVLDVSAADQNIYLYGFPAATAAYVHLLIADKRLDDAKQAVAASRAQLNKLDAAWEKSPGFRKGFGGTTFSARGSIDSLTVELENLRIKSLVNPAPAPVTAPVKPSPAPTAPPFDFDAQARLVVELTGAQRLDEAVAAYRAAMAIDLTLENGDNYLRWFPKAAAAVVGALAKAGRIEEGEELLKLSRAQLPKLEGLTRTLPPPERGLYSTRSFEAKLSKLTADLMRAEVASAKPKLSSGPVLSSEEFIKRQKLAASLLLRIEEVEKSHIVDRKTFGRDADPKFQASVKARREAFAAQAKLETSSTDHPNLIYLYGLADLPADALREAELLLAAGPGPYDNHTAIMRGLAELGNLDPALTFLNRWIDAEVTQENYVDYVKPLVDGRGVLGVMNRLGDVGRDEEAQAAIKKLKVKLDRVHRQLAAAPPRPVGLHDSESSSAKRRLDSCSDVLKSWRYFYLQEKHPEIRDQPMISLPVEIGKLLQLHIIMEKTIGRDADPEFQAKVKARREAFAELAARAEAQQSSDHAALMYAYGAADLREKALREVKLVLAAEPGEYAPYSDVMNALAELSDPGPALDFFNQWIGAPTSLENYADFIVPLKDPFTGAPAVIDRLGNVGRDAEARAALARLTAKIDELHRQFSAAAVKPAGLRESDFGKARIDLRQCNRTLDDWRGFHNNNSSRPLSFSQPLNLDREMMRLRDRRSARALGKTGGPEFDRAQADYLEGLTRLAAAAEAARSTDRFQLIGIYVDLKRADDVLRLGRLAVAENPDKFTAAAIVSEKLRQVGDIADSDAMLAVAEAAARSTDRMRLITIYADLKRADDVLRQGRLAIGENPSDFVTMAAISLKLRQVGKTADADAMRDQALAIDVTPAMAASFVTSSFFYVNKWVTALLEEKRFNDADAIIQRWQRQLASLEAKLKRNPVVQNGKTVSTEAAKARVAEFKKAIEDARRGL